MIKRVLIIGGYGNFGSFIAKALGAEADIQLIIAGRSLSKANALIDQLNTINSAEAAALDITQPFYPILESIHPDIVIHTSGPFQSQSYDVAEACIDLGAHYIDLADGRDFVKNIETLNNKAKENSLLVISGASSVPCLTSALIDHYNNEFKTIESINYGITTAQKTTRGLATTKAILSYTGKPFHTLINGHKQVIYGWQGLKAHKYKNLGWRLLGYCDVPDLELFPKRYPELKSIRFYAGLEIPLIHLVLWKLSWLVRIGLIKQLEKYAPTLLRLSFLFDWLGSANSAFHMEMSGKDKLDKNKTLLFELTAKSGDGPYIPCMPAILMTQKIVMGEITEFGAFPCMGFIQLDEYLNALSELDISWEEH